jgi:hypothetical protein
MLVKAAQNDTMPVHTVKVNGFWSVEVEFISESCG